MEVRQQTEKEELQRLQQEVESQRKESEEVQQRILEQEERLHLRSLAIESHMRLLLAQRERSSDGQEAQPRGEEVHEEIYRELERLQRERKEQVAWLQGELRHLEEQEEEQLLLVGRLGDELKEKRQAAALLLPSRGALRQEEEHRSLTKIREVLLRAKEARGQEEEVPGGKNRKAWDAQVCYRRFKEEQVKELTELEEELRKQKEQLEEKEQEKVAAHSQQESREQEEGEEEEQCLQYKESQLASLACDRLRLLEEERHRALELLQCSSFSSSSVTNGNVGAVTVGNPESGWAGLDKTLYAVEKELEEKEAQLCLLRHSEQELQQLQETYEFTANIARQEDKVRRKEKEILKNKEAQQKEAMVQAMSRLERSWALQRSLSQEPWEEKEEVQRRRRSWAHGGAVEQER